jgi:hypothetical protein
MRWTPGGTSDDIEDRRDDSGGGGFGGFGGIHLGLGGVIIVGLLSLIFQRNFFTFFSGAPGAQRTEQRTPNRAQDAREQPEVQFVSFVLDDVQNTWTEKLPAVSHVQYRRSKLVLFRSSFPSACGEAETAIGPFYCPGDQKVYLDLSFFDELKRRFGAPGEFAQAYVIAHEIGHHVQDLVGIEHKVRRLQQENPGARNKLSVRLELQADCLAGIWGNSTKQRNLIDENDVEQGLQAAAAVGDDRLQKASRGYVSPESFTHGSSQERVHWFRRGLDSGQVSACAELTRFGK